MTPAGLDHYALSFSLPLLATLILTPLAARTARRFGVIDRPAPSKFHRHPTPYLGGLALAGGLFVGALLAEASLALVSMLAGAAALAAIGLIDDLRTVRPALKLGVEIAAGLLLWVAGIRAGLFGVGPVDLALTVIWVVVVVNAVNLLDNMDGLLAGVASIAALTIALLGAASGQYLVAGLAMTLAGAGLGFLPHNFPPAKIFMGDTGSLMIGLLLAALTLKLGIVGQAGPLWLIAAVLLLGVPIFDTSLAVTARLLGRRPIYVGGTDHSSHRLAALGLSSRRVTAVTCGAQVACCLAALSLLTGPLMLALGTTATLSACGIAAFVLLLRITPPLARRGSEEVGQPKLPAVMPEKP